MRAQEDLPPLPGGDTLTVQSNLIDLENLGEQGGQPTMPGFGVPAPKPAATPPPAPPPKKFLELVS
jgi:hypothetical protein